MIYTILYAYGENGYEIDLDKRGNMYVVMIWDGHNYKSSRLVSNTDSYNNAERAFYAACDMYGIRREDVMTVDHDPSNWDFD